MHSLDLVLTMIVSWKNKQVQSNHVVDIKVTPSIELKPFTLFSLSISRPL